MNFSIPEVVSDFFTDDLRFFIKSSRNGFREFKNMNQARYTLATVAGEYELRVPVPLGARPGAVSQERLHGFKSLDRQWLENPAEVARCAIDVLLATSAMPVEAIPWSSSPEIVSVDIGLIRNSNSLHNLAQKALVDDDIRRVVAEPLPEFSGDAFVHGDFKPDNLMIAPDRSVVAVIDWENAGIGAPELDAASLIAGLIYVSVRSAVKADGTEWKNLTELLNHVGSVERAWVAKTENANAFRLALAKYLFIRLCGYYNDVEQDDRCAFILKKLIKKTWGLPLV